MDFYDQLADVEISADWNAIRLVARGKEELDTIQRVIARVCCRELEMYKAGKQIETLNPAQSSYFPRFLLKFTAIYKDMPEAQKTFANVMFYLKIVNLNADDPENPVELSEYDDFSRILLRAGNILIKDLLENARNLYPNDQKPRMITARDLLDGVVMSRDPEDSIFKENAFLKLKNSLINITNRTGNGISDYEKKLFDNERKLNVSS